MKITKDKYKELIKEDLEWLSKMPNSLEKQHIEAVLKNSINQFYKE